MQLLSPLCNFEPWKRLFERDQKFCLTALVNTTFRLYRRHFIFHWLETSWAQDEGLEMTTQKRDGQVYFRDKWNLTMYNWLLTCVWSCARSLPVTQLLYGRVLGLYLWLNLCIVSCSVSSSHLTCVLSCAWSLRLGWLLHGLVLGLYLCLKLCMVLCSVSPFDLTCI